MQKKEKPKLDSRYMAALILLIIGGAVNTLVFIYLTAISTIANINEKLIDMMGPFFLVLLILSLWNIIMMIVASIMLHKKSKKGAVWILIGAFFTGSLHGLFAMVFIQLSSMATSNKQSTIAQYSGDGTKIVQPYYPDNQNEWIDQYKQNRFRNKKQED